MDQAQHFGAVSSSSSGAYAGQAGEDFRNGLDETERKSAFPLQSYDVVLLKSFSVYTRSRQHNTNKTLV